MAANIDHGVILGALGSLHTDGTGAVYPPTGMVIAAIQFISKNTPTALVAENPDKFFNTAHAANSLSGGSETVDEGSGGKVVDSVTFARGITIYGRWSEIDVSSGGIVAYIGD